ncbi:hypothetical protein PsAD2_03483 [Pseudovibrio axinellae]|uniref:Uncharacterized protein n=1 Tax=Pseudovibrio axinellae TaxID=989403 RepID=A0A165W9Q7_9HYPH|nr:hypothetical protein PsAD2_03483 [Pseudovibrio axinellae]SER79349.1 hypothetical protein SAMN05421798_1243 [Pseudovibrio axinellae]
MMVGSRNKLKVDWLVGFNLEPDAALSIRGCSNGPQRRLVQTPPRSKQPAICAEFRTLQQSTLSFG